MLGLHVGSFLAVQRFIQAFEHGYTETIPHLWYTFQSIIDNIIETLH